MKIELNEHEAEVLSKILARNIKKTEWVLENKEPKNIAVLEENIKLMEKVCSLLKGGNE